MSWNVTVGRHVILGETMVELACSDEECATSL
jgi:hypothetical protein